MRISSKQNTPIKTVLSTKNKMYTQNEQNAYIETTSISLNTNIWISVHWIRFYTDCQICLNRNLRSREMTWLFSVRMTGNFNFTLFNTYPLEYWNWKYTNVTYFYPWFGTVDDKSYISKQDDTKRTQELTSLGLITTFSTSKVSTSLCYYIVGITS